MNPRKKARLTAEKQRELQVAAAVVREAILQAHVTRALKLIELAGDRVSALRMIEIYTRVHNLSAAESEVVAMRLLATVGQRARKGSRGPVVYVEGEDEQRAPTFVGVVRDRLRGRVLHDLRHWVDLHTGATKAALLEIYVKHSLRFIEELRSTHTIAQALMIYQDMVEVPRSMQDALHIFALDKLAASELPGGRMIAAVPVKEKSEKKVSPLKAERPA